MSENLKTVYPTANFVLLITVLLGSCETSNTTGRAIDNDRPGNSILPTPSNPDSDTPTVAAPEAPSQNSLSLALCSNSVSNPPAQTVGLIVNRSSHLACRDGVQFMVVPAPDSCMTSGYGNRLRDGKLKFHKGIDYQGPGRTALPVVAAADGTVVINKYRTKDLGNWIVIDHGNNIYTGYGHLAGKPDIAVGSAVKRGDKLAMMGSTGPAARNRVHLHVEFRKGVLRNAANGGYFNLEHFNPFEEPANCPTS